MTLLSTKEVATLLKCNARKVQYLVDKGELIPVKKFHRYTVFDENEVINYLKGKENQNG